MGETINSFSEVSDAYDTIEFGAASVDIDYILGIGTLTSPKLLK